MTNEAAELLRQHMSDFHGNCPWVGEDHIVLFDAALAAERKAGADEERERIANLPETLRAKGWYIVASFDKTLIAILDAEAAR